MQPETQEKNSSVNTSANLVSKKKKKKMLSQQESISNLDAMPHIDRKCILSGDNVTNGIKSKKKKKNKKKERELESENNLSTNENGNMSVEFSKELGESLSEAMNEVTCSPEVGNETPVVKTKKNKKNKNQKHLNDGKLDTTKDPTENVSITNCPNDTQEFANSEPGTESKILKQKKKKRSYEEEAIDDEVNFVVGHDKADCSISKKKHKKSRTEQNAKLESEEGRQCSVENDIASCPAQDVDNSDVPPEQPSCSLQVTENDLEVNLEGKIGDCKYFSDMKTVLSAPTMAAIESLGFTELTEIQARAIPPLLEGKDLRGTAKTGSGKTLAFLIPAFELLHRLEFQQHHGTGVIILCPTRELAMQTFGVTQILGDRHNLSYGLLIGGANRAAESKALKQGVNVLVACPGRMLDHLKNTSGFEYSNLVCLVLDEADRMLSIGFEEEMKAILKLIPKRRQTMLFSATRNERTDNLTTIALKVTLVDVDLMAEKSHATVDQLNQYYLVCPVEQRFLVLYTFLRRKKNKKVMVFFSSCGAVKFYQELLAFIDMRVLSIHGKQKQTKRTESFMEFNASESGALLCTNVAARGWDIPAVDWIIQYDPPEDVNEYIHRVGRTARGGKEGQALLILSEQEVGFVRCLRQRKINVEPIQIGEGKLYNIQGQLEDIMNERYLLALSGRAAFKDYLYSYMKHSQKDIFNYNRLDHAKVAKSFGFDRPPVIDLIAAFKKNKRESYQQRNKKIRRT